MSHYLHAAPICTHILLIKSCCHTQGINERHHYFCYCTVATCSYIHAIHSHVIGRSHNNLLNTSYIAQLHINVYVTDIAHYFILPYKMCMFQLLLGCNVACMQRYTVDIHRQGNTATRCLQSFHAMLAVTAGDREG